MIDKPHVITILVLALVPGLFWLWYFYRKDNLQPEPKRYVIRAFVAGMIAVLPASLLEVAGASAMRHFIAPGLWQLFIIFFLVVGPVEEFMKYAAVRLSVWRLPEFDEVMDGLIYGIAGALGFATVENFLYYQNYFQQYGWQIIIQRNLFSTLGHVYFSALWGYALGVARLDPGRGSGIIWRGLIAAAFLHGLYDILLQPETMHVLLNILNQLLAIMVGTHLKLETLSVFPIIILLVLMGIHLHRRLSSARLAYFDNDSLTTVVKHCLYCTEWVPVWSRYCQVCGAYLAHTGAPPPFLCGHCRRVVQPGDRFCCGCGRRLVTGTRIVDNLAAPVHAKLR